MAQFDVYKNPSQKSREAYPFLIDIQNELISDIKTRMVIPLGKLKHFRNEQLRGLTPIIQFQSEQYVLLTPQIASLPFKILKDPIGTAESLRGEIIAAIDFAITGI